LKIPLVDLSRQYHEVRDEIEAGWSKVLDTAAFIMGVEVDEFEQRFAAYCGAGYCVGVGNGTDAIELALRAVGIGPGDEVIVPANTFMATALAPLRAGASVRLVDCVPGTYLIDQKEVAAAISPKTRAVIPVHLFGQIAPIDEIERSFPDVVIVEDAAQAQGATRFGNAIGAFGVVAATSFYPGKNLGAFGDAGAVLTNDPDLAARMRALANWGSDRKYHHPVAGFNSRLDTLQAVVLSVKLGRLDQWNGQRRRAAELYDRLLGGQEQVALPTTLFGNVHVFHLYVVEVDNRDEALTKIHQDGIGAGVHYPVPLHLQGALAELGHQHGDFPNTERAAKRMISLPIFPGITPDEQHRVVASLLDAL
jgi:dTDP-4-amino-4,6-dideoxygalactose transaminase